MRPALGALLAIAWLAAHAEPLRFEALRIDWPAGYRAVVEGSKARIDGPDGARIEGSYMPARSGWSEQETHAFMVRGEDFARRNLPALADQRGARVTALRRSAPAPETVVYHTATRVAAPGGVRHYLQYLVIGRAGMALFTIDGEGPAEAHAPRYDAVFDGARWAAPEAPARH